MLIQLPQGPSDRKNSSDENSADFEAALRRDLASSPIVSFDPVLGGWGKRVIDLTLSLLLAPLWLPTLLIAAAWAKLRVRGEVFIAHEGVSYGGRVFQFLSLRLSRPAPTEDGEAANDWTDMARVAETRGAKWRRAIERLPQMFNVISGDMALVGPRPLSRFELEPMRSARRYYLSARPGVIGVASIAEADIEEPAHYKMYALSWALSTDAIMLGDAVRSLIQRGELWKPSALKAKSENLAATPAVAARRRRSS